MAQVDKKPCYFGAMLIHVTAASRVAYIRGGPEVKKWVGENNPCPSLFTGWGEDTEAVRAAKSRRDLDGDDESGDTDFSQFDMMTIHSRISGTFLGEYFQPGLSDVRNSALNSLL